MREHFFPSEVVTSDRLWALFLGVSRIFWRNEAFCVIWSRFSRGSKTLLGWQELEKSVLGPGGDTPGAPELRGTTSRDQYTLKREAKDVLKET